MKLYHNIEYNDHRIQNVYTFSNKLESNRFAQKWLRKQINNIVVRNGIIELYKRCDEYDVKWKNRYCKADYIRMKYAIKHHDIWDVLESFGFATCDAFEMVPAVSEINEQIIEDCKKSPKNKYIKMYHNIFTDNEDFEKDCEVKTFGKLWQSEDEVEKWLSYQIFSDIDDGLIKCTNEEAVELDEAVGNNDVWDVMDIYLKKTERMIGYARMVNYVELKKLKLGVLE